MWIRTTRIGSVCLALLSLSVGCEPCAGKTGDDLTECEAEQTGDEEAVDSNPTTNEHTQDDLPAQCTDLANVMARPANALGWASDSTDEEDFYCFELDSVAAVTVNLQHDGPLAADIYEYAPAVDAALGQLTSEMAVYDLLPGRYALRVFAPGFGRSEYELIVSAVSHHVTEPNPEPGATADEAYPLSPGATLDWTDGYVGDQDATDLYRVTVPAGQRLGIQLDHLGTSGTLHLSVAPYAAIPDFMEPVLEQRPGLATLEPPLEEGEYLLRVEGEAVYRLGLALQPADN